VSGAEPSLFGTHRVWAGFFFMVYSILADAVLLVHFAFIAFVVAGGLLVLRRPRVAWIHLPAVVWGVLIELFGWICPLTPLEVALRRHAGGLGYETGFLEHYLISLIYPAGLTRGIQFALAAGVIAINVLVYGWVVRRRRRS